MDAFEMTGPPRYAKRAPGGADCGAGASGIPCAGAVTAPPRYPNGPSPGLAADAVAGAHARTPTATVKSLTRRTAAPRRGDGACPRLGPTVRTSGDEVYRPIGRLHAVARTSPVRDACPKRRVQGTGQAGWSAPASIRAVQLPKRAWSPAMPPR